MRGVLGDRVDESSKAPDAANESARFVVTVVVAAPDESRRRG
jgi:hypothetical protein